MIPRIIHQWWAAPSGDGAVPSDIILNARKWKELHPDYIYKMWDLHSIYQLLIEEGLDTSILAIDSARFPSMKSDIIRLFLLYIFGGFWVDLKLSPMHRIDEAWRQNSLILPQHFDQEGIENSENKLLNSFIGSSIHNQFIEQCMLKAVENVKSRLEGSIFDITGGGMISNLRGTGDLVGSGDVLILDKVHAWNRFLQLTPGSYNANGMHWSVRERVEPLYIDICAHRENSADARQIAASLAEAARTLATTVAQSGSNSTGLDEELKIRTPARKAETEPERYNNAGAVIYLQSKWLKLDSFRQSLKAIGYVILPYNKRRRAKRKALLSALRDGP